MSTKKPRKSLDDALANEFVFGSTPTPPEIEQPQVDNVAETISAPTENNSSVVTQAIETITPSPEPQPSIMSQLQQVPPKEATIRLTVDLTESMPANYLCGLRKQVAKSLNLSVSYLIKHFKKLMSNAVVK